MKPTYDNLGISFAPGDIITTYFKGYWELIEIQRRFIEEKDLAYYERKGKKVGDELSPLFLFKLVMNDKFELTTRKSIKDCDASYCRKIDATEIQKMRDKYNQGCDRLLGLLK